MEEKYNNVVSYVLKNGGILDNAHIYFDEEAFEEANQNKEVVSDKKRKYKELDKEISSKETSKEKKKNNFGSKVAIAKKRRLPN